MSLRRLQILFLFVSTCSLKAGGIYWTERANGALGVRTAALDGSGPVAITGLQSRTDPRGIVADPIAGRLYFNDKTVMVSVVFNFITKTAGALSNIASATTLRDLCMDRKNLYLYYADENVNQIGRVALPGAVADGASPSFPKTASAPYFLTVAETTGGWPASAGSWKLLAGNSNTTFYAADGPVGSTTMNTLSLPVVSPSLDNVRGVQIDTATSWFYWCEKDTFRIRRAKFDGTTTLSNVQNVYTGLCAAHGLWLDQPRGKLYWVDSGTNASGLGKGGVNRGDVDGSGAVETLVVQNAGSSQPWDLDVDVSVTSYNEWLQLYFRKDAAAADKLAAANPDGDEFTNVQEFFFGMNPLRRDTQPATASVWTDPNTTIRYPAITFLRRPLVSTTISTPVVSTDLTNWSATMRQVSVAAADEGMERVTYRSATALTATDRQYMRVSVTGP